MLSYQLGLNPPAYTMVNIVTKRRPSSIHDVCPLLREDNTSDKMHF